MNCQAVNPYLPSFEYVPDAEPRVFGERVYVYGSHDQFDGKDFCMKDYVCWSASIYDLANWKYEGIIYKREQDKYLSDAKDRRLFAPDVQRGIDGRYYLYYAYDFSGVIGVAVCDTPAGGYEYYGHVQYADGTFLGKKENDVFQYDPGIFVDSVGKVYLYSGFCPVKEMMARFNLPKPIAKGAMVIELEEDMITIKKEPTVMIPSAEYAKGTSFEGHGFFEAASMRKMGEQYYFIYSSENGHELCYATSNKPNTDFVYGGVIISNGDIGYQGRKEPLNYTGTNHGSIEHINNQWYVFYHRQTNGNPYSRQGCAEKIEVLRGGGILQAEMTSCGLNKGPLKGKGVYQAGIACCLMSKNGATEYKAKSQVSSEHPFITQEGEDRESNPDQYIANLQAGAVVGFKYFNIKELEKISVTIRGNGQGKIKVYTKLWDRVAAQIEITAMKEWVTFSQPMQIEAGVTSLWFVYEGNGFIELKSFELR